MKPLVTYFFSSPDDVCREESERFAQKLRMNRLKRLQRRLEEKR